ncbi:MAG TPA: sigma-70 family RNA polymerase sigma factor [Gemmataceae bacterium]|nr:sigma-70 family RNA polymerase sigma factor [Gemmataceae bacterium]
METPTLGLILRYLRRLAAPAEGGRLDAELIERFVARRDGAAFARLVERHGPLVLGVCRRVLRNHHDAEDAFQATFLVLARKARLIRRRDALPGWLHKVAYRLALNLRASAERRRRAERQAPPSPQKLADDAITWGDLRTVLDEELDRLPEKYRAPLLLCCLAGRTRDEAAEQLGWTVGALKMRLERARQLLRARLARRGLTVPATLLAMLFAQQATATPVPATLATATARAAPLFAAGATPAGLSARVVRLAGVGLSAGRSPAILLGAAVLLTLVGVAGGVLLSPRPPAPPTGRTAAGDAARPAPEGFVDATEESGLGALLRRHYARFPGWHPSGATLLDIDGDGQLDLHLAGQSECLAALGRNDGGRFVAVDPRPELPRGPRHWAELPYPGGQVRHAFDFNEDGRLDLAVSWHNNGGTLYHNATAGGAPRFRRAEFIRPEFPDVLTSALADVNRDGVVDFLTSDGETDVAVHLGRGDGTFGPAPDAVIPAGLRCAGAIPVDLDGDGRLELIARQSEHEVPARRKIFRSTGPLQWADVTRECGLADAGSVHGVGDVNQDGHPDLICVEGEQIVIYLNDGKGRFVRKADAVRRLERASERPGAEWGDRWGGAVVVDFDNDGIPDVIINGRCFLYLLRGTGGGSFEYVNDLWGLPDFAYCDVDDGLCFGDVNGDGRLDLVIAGGPIDYKRRPLRLYLNRLAERHWLRVQLVGRPGNAAATGAKIRLYEPGKPDRLLAYEQVAVWGRQSFHSYYAARRTERHFGLGRYTAVDVSVEFYPSGRRVERTGVPADGTVVIAEPGR